MTTTTQGMSRPSGLRLAGIGANYEHTLELEEENALLRVALTQSEDLGDRRELEALELKHRIGNLLAVVHAFARQTFKDPDAPGVADFTGRLQALSAAQSLLIDGSTSTTSLDAVARLALAPHLYEGDGWTISGPTLQINGRRAHALTLALHELGTNAAKYGALSVDGGRVEVTWTLANQFLELNWREHGGPPVVKPTRRGFGHLLITRNLAVAFSGEVALDFNEAGVQCRLRAPAS